MDSKSHSLLIFISLLLILSSSSSFVEATCKASYLTYPIPSSSSSQPSHISNSSSTPPPQPKQASTPLSSPPPSPPKPSSSPPPPSTSSPPPPTPKSSPPPPPTPTPSPSTPSTTPTPTPSTPSTTQAAGSISLLQTPTTSLPQPKPILPSIPSIPSVVTPVSGGINADIKNVCAKTDNVDLCLSSIAPFIVPGKTDPVSVFGMQLQAVTAHTQTALTTATQMFLNPSTPKIVKSCMEDCKDVYEDAIDNLKSAADALTRRDFPTVDSMLSAAISDFGTCEDGFADFEEQSPMSAADELLQKMTGNLLALSSVCKTLP